MKKIILTVAALLFVAACGSSSSNSNSPTLSGGTSGSVSPGVAAISAACAGGSSDSGSGAASESDIKPDTNKALGKLVAKKLGKSIDDRVKKFGKDVFFESEGDTINVIFDNELLKSGLTVNGTLSFTITDVDQNTMRLVMDGNLTSTMDGFTESVVIEGQGYSEVLNGYFTLDFGGDATATDDAANNAWTVALNMTFTTTSSQVDVNGDVTGSITEMSISSTVTGNAAESSDELQVSCGGNLKVDHNGSVETCNLTEDCLGCE